VLGVLVASEHEREILVLGQQRQASRVDLGRRVVNESVVLVDALVDFGIQLERARDVDKRRRDVRRLRAASLHFDLVRRPVPVVLEHAPIDVVL
jgi:hypoxanthine-guanine phosphoribosyltransferase